MKDRHPVAELFDVVAEYPYISGFTVLMLFLFFCFSVKVVIHLKEKRV